MATSVPSLGISMIIVNELQKFLFGLYLFALAKIITYCSFLDHSLIGYNFSLTDAMKTGLGGDKTSIFWANHQTHLIMCSKRGQSLHWIYLGKWFEHFFGRIKLLIKLLNITIYKFISSNQLSYKLVNVVYKWGTCLKKDMSQLEYNECQ